MLRRAMVFFSVCRIEKLLFLFLVDGHIKTVTVSSTKIEKMSIFGKPGPLLETFKSGGERMDDFGLGEGSIDGLF